MGFKDLFIKEEEQPKQHVVAQEVAPSAQSIIPTQSIHVQEATPTNTGIVDKEIEGKIWDMIVAKNLPGPDYIEFKIMDWLNAHHFDYRGLIEKGLALEAPEGMYNIKNK